MADLPDISGVEASSALHVTQIHAQHLGPASVLPAYDLNESHITVDFEACNPDKDIIGTGACLLARHAESVHVYSADGRYLTSIHSDCMHNLAQQANLSLVTPTDLPVTIKALLIKPLHDVRTCSPSMLLNKHFTLPSTLRV